MKKICILALALCLLQCVNAQVKTAVLSGIIRDHCGATTPAMNGFPACTHHPDFENVLGDNVGALMPTINTTDQTPIYGAGGSTFHGASWFYTWYHTTPGWSMQAPINITLSNAGNADARVLTYSNQAFFPIDNQLFGNQGNIFKDANGNPHNFGFTVEFHSRFFYQGGENFTFVGDDDMWVFINNQMVIDLGGVHAAETKTVLLDTLGLTKGQNYQIDIFYAERHTVASDIRIDTTLQLFCGYIDRCGICEGSGTTCPCLCNDNNACTTDTCNKITGACTFTPITCTSTDPCQTASCSNVTGGCVLTPVTCNDMNACTTDTCVAGSGCAFTPIVCNSHDPCIQDSCNSQTGCQKTPTVCNDNNLCTTDTCVSGVGCEFTPVVCPFTFPCEVNTCNPQNGQCVNNTANCNGCQGVTCNGDACNVAHCVAPPGTLPGHGTCQNTTVNCASGNLCILDSCNAASGCVHQPVVCTTDACHNAVCNPTTGHCDVTPVNCDDGNGCTLDSCTVNGGTFTCNHVLRTDCPGTNNCTIAFCDPPPGLNGCTTKPVNCDDGSSCTQDSCDPAVGCVHTNLCVGDKCTTSSCIASNCVSFSTVCPINNPGGVNCWNAVCDPVAGCSVTQRQDNQAACAFLVLPPGAQAGVLSGGIIAAIVIGIILFLVVSAIGTKKGYDYWKKHDKMVGTVQSNPLFESEMKGGDNPLYVGLPA